MSYCEVYSPINVDRLKAIGTSHNYASIDWLHYYVRLALVREEKVTRVDIEEGATR